MTAELSVPSPTDNVNLFRRMRVFVIVGLLLASVLMCAVSASRLYSSHQQVEQRAELLTRNVTRAIDLNISKDVATIDLVLQSAVDALQAQLTGKDIDLPATTAKLRVLARRVPAIEAVRVVRADGQVIADTDQAANPAATGQTHWIDRDDFTFHRDHADSGLQISAPHKGATSEQWVVSFSRRYSDGQGRFAGVVSVHLAVSYFTALLTQFDVGPHGTLLLRDAQRRLLTRVPALPNLPAGQVGSQIMSTDFLRVFNLGQDTASGFTSASPDGYRRVFSFQRIKAVPLVAIVATADTDYLSGWYTELYLTLLILGSFLAIAALLGAATLRLSRSCEAAAQRTAQDKAFMISVLDSLSEQVAVIDADGVILLVNAAWRKFALENGLADPAKVGVGANYLAACTSACDSPDSDDASRVYQGVQAVISGQQSVFALEYPCHSPQVQRWFVMRVLPLVDSRGGAVVIHQDVSERYRAQARLQASEERFRLLFDTSIDGIMLTAPDGRIFSANRSACLMLQRCEAEIQQLGRSGIVDAQDPRLVPSLDVRRTNGQTACELTFTRNDGSKFPCDVSSTIYLDGHGEVRSSVVIRDITERKRAEKALKESEARLSALFQSSPVGIVLSKLSDGTIIDINDACLRLFGYARHEVIGARSMADLEVYLDPEQRVAMVKRLRESGGVEDMEVDFCKRQGQTMVVSLSARLVEVNSEACMLAVLTDITQRKLEAARMHDFAFHDALTRLPNRRLLSDRIQQAMVAGKRSGLHGAVLYLDLDNFKPLNDQHGHDVGDALLMDTAQRLQLSVRQIDTVARVGGDEFVVLLSELPVDVSEAAQLAQAVAEKIAHTLGQSYVLTVHRQSGPDQVIEHRCTASIGVALFRGDALEVQELLKRADAAMYLAKHAGRNAIRFAPGA